tara:strand:- start:12723 stop:13079 length:357 start_codon:yes stop_codon:yes gene_type:complete
MWIRVLTNSDIVVGDVLSFDTGSQTWSKASSMTTPLGVARTSAALKIGSDSDYVVEMVMQGQVLARASRDIPNQGGELNVENGSVYVDNGADHEGIIAPNALDSPDRLAGDLVTVIIR